MFKLLRKVFTSTLFFSQSPRVCQTIRDPESTEREKEMRKFYLWHFPVPTKNTEGWAAAETFLTDEGRPSTLLLRRLLFPYPQPTVLEHVPITAALYIHPHLWSGLEMMRGSRFSKFWLKRPMVVTQTHTRTTTQNKKKKKQEKSYLVLTPATAIIVPTSTADRRSWVDRTALGLCCWVKQLKCFTTKEKVTSRATQRPSKDCLLTTQRP